jgi:hypothetical protein
MVMIEEDTEIQGGVWKWSSSRVHGGIVKDENVVGTAGSLVDVADNVAATSDDTSEGAIEAGGGRNAGTPGGGPCGGRPTASLSGSESKSSSSSVSGSTPVETGDEGGATACLACHCALRRSVKTLRLRTGDSK